MPVAGVVPFPPEFARRYRERGYWRDRSLREEFAAAFARHAGRIGLDDGDRSLTYADIDRVSTNLALNLVALGLRPLDRVVVQLPNVAEFVLLYVALQKAGAIPVAALVSHRFTEIVQFVELSGARMLVAPDRVRDFDFAPLVQRVRAASPGLCHTIVLGDAPPGCTSLRELIERPAPLPPERLAEIDIDPADPAIFQLSGAGAGIPKLIPRTHNDYAYNSRIAAEVCGAGAADVLLLVLPIAHHLPLANPGLQGYLLASGRVVLGTSTRAIDMLGLIHRHRVTHVPLVPTLLARLLDEPAIGTFDLSSLRTIQSGGARLAPEVRERAQRLIPSAFIQENFTLSEGLSMFVRRDDPKEVRLETVGRPLSPDDEVRLVDQHDRVVVRGEIGELCARGPYTLRGYYGVPAYNARRFSADGFYRSGDLMRELPSGNYVFEGRRNGVINRGGEKISVEEIENLIRDHPAVQDVTCIAIPDPDLGERLCACVLPRAGATLELAELRAFLSAKDIATFKLPERLELLTELPARPERT